MTVMVMVLAILVFGVGYPLLALHHTRRPRRRRAMSRWWESDGGDTWGDGGSDGGGDGGCDGGCDGGGGGDGGCD